MCIVKKYLFYILWNRQFSWKYSYRLFEYMDKKVQKEIHKTL